MHRRVQATEKCKRRQEPRKGPRSQIRPRKRPGPNKAQHARKGPQRAGSRKEIFFGCILDPYSCSRMRSRRVPVLRLGSRGSRRRREVVALCSQSVRKRSQAFGSVRKRSQTVRKRPQASAEGRTCRRDERDENRRDTQNCRHFLRFVLQKSTVTGIREVLVAKRRTIVTFGLASGLRVSKVSTLTGIRGVGGRERQNRRHFWPRLGSSRLKSVNSHRDPGGPGRETQNCHRF